MKETYSFTKERIADIEYARYQLIGIANALNLHNIDSNHLIQAINIINKILQLSEERILTINEVSFLDTIIGITDMNSNNLTVQARIANHLDHYSDLVNELNPPSSWFTTIINYISCTSMNSADAVYPCDNSGLTELHTGGNLLYRSACAPSDIKKERQNSYQETYKVSHQSSSEDKEPSFSGDFKMHDFDYDPDSSNAYT